MNFEQFQNFSFVSILSSFIATAETLRQKMIYHLFYYYYFEC